MAIRNIREKINLLLYGSKARNLNFLRLVSFLVSLLAICVIAYRYGYPQTEESKWLLLNIIQASFAFYLLHYIVRYVYDFQPLQFLKRTWVEGLIMLLLVVEGVGYNFFDKLFLQELLLTIGMDYVAPFTALFIQVYFLFIVANQLLRSSPLLPKITLHPAVIFILSFLGLIGMGTALLMLPEMTTEAGGMRFIDALFTSTSATCVTGLIVEDTPTFFTFKGHAVLLMLVKLGGLNIIAFGSFIALAAKFGVGVKQHSVIEDFVNKESPLSTRNTFGRIVLWSVIIEVIGSVVMYFMWSPEIEFKHTGDKVFHSLFHSVSAFNNAGLSLFTDGLYNEAVRTNYLVHIVVTVLVFFGALGFTSIFDLFDPGRLRERLKYPWKTISFSTKISLYFSIVLVLGGAVLLYILEFDNTIKDQNFVEGTITSIFQSATRTSGFNTVDIGSMAVPSLVLLMFLMFVGSSSSSTGGGIKTSTFALILAAAWSTMRGKPRTELFGRSISKELTYRAFSVFFFFIAGNLVAIFALTITETHILEMPDRSIIDLMFENVSALGTTGLSTGITAMLSDPGKIIIVLSMFVGRVGTLTVAYAFGKAVLTSRYKLPYGHTMVG